MSVELKDDSIKVKAALNDATVKFLYEAAHVIESQVKQNTEVDTGQLKASWNFTVDESNGEATIGSPVENAIWEEFGTGEYALHGDGRKGGWVYVDEKGGHFTRGKKPRRMLYNAFETKRSAIVKEAERIIKSEMGK